MAQNEPGRQHAAAYEFHVFRLEIPEQLLLRDGRPLPLTPRAFDLLAYFVQHPQRLLEKTTLLRDVWRDAIVEEANLAFQVSVLRRVLDDGRSDDSLIQTVPTKGYRFVPPVTVIPSSVPHGQSVAGPIDAAPAQSVASARWVRTAAWVAVLLVIAATVVIVTSFRRPAAAQLEPEAMLTRLTALPAGVQVDMARISNNGRFVAWSEPEGLRVLVIDSGDSRVLPKTAGFVPYGWSADSTALRAFECDAPTCRGWEISIVGEAWRRTGARWANGDLVSLDGTVGLRVFSGRAVSIDAMDGKPPGVPTVLPPGRGWSLTADSRRILYIPQDGVDLHSVPIHGGTSTAVYKPDPGQFIEEAADLAGGRLALLLTRRAPGSVRSVTEYSIQVATTDPSGVAHDSPKVVVPWRQDEICQLTGSGDGTRLLFRSGPPGDRVYVAPYDPALGVVSEPTRLTHAEWEESVSAWTADSAAVLLTSTRGGDNDIFVQPIDGRPAEPLVVGAGDQWRPEPSSDGRWLYYAEDGEDNTRILRMPLAGGRADPVGVVKDVGFPRCSFRGRCFVEAVPEPNLLLLTPIDAAGHPGSVLKLRWDEGKALAGFCVLPDGNSAALLLTDLRNGNSSTIRVVSLIDQTSKDTAVPHAPNLTNVDPMPDGSLLASLPLKANRRGLVLVRPDGTWKVLWAPKTADVFSAIASPDGHHLAITAEVWPNDVWVASGF